MSNSRLSFCKPPIFPETSEAYSITICQFPYLYFHISITTVQFPETREVDLIWQFFLRPPKGDSESMRYIASFTYTGFNCLHERLKGLFNLCELIAAF